MVTDEDKKSILMNFIELYCAHHHHKDKSVRLCGECRELADYAEARLQKCGKNPKPSCSDCDTPCYAPDYRQRIARVMRYSGMYYVRRGRVDWLLKYFVKGMFKSRKKSEV